MNYQVVKKRGLMLLYACAFNADADLIHEKQKLQTLIINELLSGVDET